MPSTRGERSSAILVALPFRCMLARWGNITEASDRARSVYLYGGVFDGERWIPSSPDVETWADKIPQSEVWTEKTKQSENWVSLSDV